jgi:hypothetical protein
MKIIITEAQLNTLTEIVTKDEVICDNCEWSWKLADGGDDPYICHKCGHDNEEKNYIGKKVMVYYNLHLHTFSVKHKNKVIAHADFVNLADVEFRVRPGGRDNVLKQQQKNVHAFVIGTLIDYCEYPCSDIPKPESADLITYDPYKYNSFVYKKDETPIYVANVVHMINAKDKIFVIKK